MEEEQEWYEESPEPEPLSPATQKRILEEFKRDVDECTTDSDSKALQSIAQHYGPEGKTMSELDEIIAEYKRTTTESRMQAVRRMDGKSLQHVFARCINSIYESRFTEELARSRPAKIARVSPAIKLTPATAAPRPAKVSPPTKFPVLDERLRISSSKVRPLVSASHDVPLDRPVAQSPGPPRRRHHPALVTRPQSKVRLHHSPRRALYMTTFRTGCAGGTFSPLQATQALVRGILVYEAPLHPQEGGWHLVRASWRTDLPYAAA